MLPFLKPKTREVGVTVLDRAQTEPKEKEEDQGLTQCAFDILKAVDDKNVQALAAALRAAHEICDTYPHEEASHDESMTE